MLRLPCPGADRHHPMWPGPNVRSSGHAGLLRRSMLRLRPGVVTELVTESSEMAVTGQDPSTLRKPLTCTNAHIAGPGGHPEMGKIGVQIPPPPPGAFYTRPYEMGPSRAGLFRRGAHFCFEGFASAAVASPGRTSVCLRTHGRRSGPFPSMAVTRSAMPPGHGLFVEFGVRRRVAALLLSPGR